MSLSPQHTIIALYLGESFGHLGVFNSDHKKIFDRAFFLPQTNLKSVLTQTQLELQSQGLTTRHVYVVSKYFDRLRNFRLGGSVAQVVDQDFENSYTVTNDKCLSLAAASLVISVAPGQEDETFFNSEIDRIKKINPDVNKVVLCLKETNSYQLNTSALQELFETKGFKVFKSAGPSNMKQIRLTLLQGGTEGTKDELLEDFTTALGPDTTVHFWTDVGFKSEFQNFELFNSANSFLGHINKKDKNRFCGYFDIESFRVISSEIKSDWPSPWGLIPTNWTPDFPFQFQPLSELKLNELSIINLQEKMNQYEPGPVLAGRGIKPLLLDLFYDQLIEIEFMNLLFPQLRSDNYRNKVSGQVSILFKAQSHDHYRCDLLEMKAAISSHVNRICRTYSNDKDLKYTGPLAKLFDVKAAAFSWPDIIFKEVGFKK